MLAKIMGDNRLIIGVTLYNFFLFERQIINSFIYQKDPQNNIYSMEHLKSTELFIISTYRHDFIAVKTERYQHNVDNRFR